jgi:hypothetical protein
MSCEPLLLKHHFTFGVHPKNQMDFAHRNPPWANFTMQQQLSRQIGTVDGIR